jgi:hypothetical protein
MKKQLIALVASFIVIANFSTGWATPLLNIAYNEPEYADSLLIGASHDIPETQGKEGWYNANLYALADVTLTYEFLGFEAGWTNSFLVDGELAFLNKPFGGYSASSNGDQVYSTAAAGSLLDFAFEILAGGNVGQVVANGANVHPTNVLLGNGFGHPNFFLGYADDSRHSVYITLDDGGGTHWNTDPDDDDHDDLAIKVTAVPVPEPATMLLLGTGLVGLAGLGRKKFLKK